MTQLDPVYQTLKEQDRYAYTVDTYSDHQIYDRIIAARAEMLGTLPFFGMMAMALIFVETDRVPTMAVDNFHIFYNMQFVNRLTPDELIFVIGHEVTHYVLEHVRLSRIAGRDFAIWARAVDYVTNAELITSKCGKMPEGGLYDPRFDGWSVEMVYDHLLTESKQSAAAAMAIKGKGQPGQKSFDIHIPVAGDGEDRKSISNHSGSMCVFPDTVLEQRRVDTIQLIHDAVMIQEEAAQRGETAGTVPASVIRWMKEYIEPKVNWKAKFLHYTKRVNSPRYSYIKPNKAMFSRGWTIPSFKKKIDTIEICIAIDASGSVSQESINAFMTEIRSMTRTFPKFKLTVWTFDSTVKKKTMRVITPETIQALMEFNVIGGGGTKFSPNWTYLRKLNIKPRLLLVFTDGYPNDNDWGEPHYCPTMFLIKNDAPADMKPVAPFGITAYYD